MSCQHCGTTEQAQRTALGYRKFCLNLACRALAEAFGYYVFLVGSSLERRDYRGVDIRCILDERNMGDYYLAFPEIHR